MTYESTLVYKCKSNNTPYYYHCSCFQYHKFPVKDSTAHQQTVFASKLSGCMSHLNDGQQLQLLCETAVILEMKTLT
jgi:hypothetical protein